MGSHAGDLDWFFSAGGTRFFSSPFGRILDIQHARYIDPKQGQKRGGGAYKRDPTHFETSWQYMHVKAEDHGQPAEPELKDLHRFGHVSSALYKLEKVNPIYTSVLIGYFGDYGARWSQERGEGRLLAIYALTETGAKWVAYLERNSELKLRPDERLATECFQQEINPEDVRRARLKKVEVEARALLDVALSTYVQLATS